MREQWVRAVRSAVMGLAMMGAAGCGPDAANPAASAAAPKLRVDAAQAGTVAGVVRFAGTPPPPRSITMSTGDCGMMHRGAILIPEVDVHDGRLAGAFVYVKSGLERYAFDPPVQDVLLDQKGCMFVPRILGVQVGQRLKMVNSDATLHNVHTLPQENDTYNRGFPNQGSVEGTSFSEPEVMIPIRCDLHSWMTGFVGVVAHPFHAVTGADGSFRFVGLPAGDYEIEAWHETLKVARARISLKPKQSAAVELVFGK